jgi:hypothetical protein
MDRSVRNARRTLMHLIEGEGHAANPLGLMLGGAMAGGPAGGAQAEQRRKALRELIPTEEELENSFTASVAQGYLNEHGFVSESVVELLPPEE